MKSLFLITVLALTAATSANAGYSCSYFQEYEGHAFAYAGQGSSKKAAAQALYKDCMDKGEEGDATVEYWCWRVWAGSSCSKLK